MDPLRPVSGPADPFDIRRSLLNRMIEDARTALNALRQLKDHTDTYLETRDPGSALPRSQEDVEEAIWRLTDVHNALLKEQRRIEGTP